MCSAHAVQLKLESHNILEKTFAEYPVSLCVCVCVWGGGGSAVTYIPSKYSYDCCVNTV